MLHSHTWITQETWNTKNTYDFLVQVRNFLLPLSLKVFQHKEERGTIFLWRLFHLPLPPPRAAPTARPWQALKSTFFFPGRNSTPLTDFSQISAHASGAWHHSHPLATIPIWDFYFDISEWHILPMCAWTPALMLHLTNPWAKWKVLSLTKLKGKIYKMKSLGHYITKGCVDKLNTINFHPHQSIYF